MTQLVPERHGGASEGPISIFGIDLVVVPTLPQDTAILVQDERRFRALITELFMMSPLALATTTTTAQAVEGSSMTPEKLREAYRRFLEAYGVQDAGRFISNDEPVPVAGDEQSVVPAATITELVDLARQGRREDFNWLAASEGVAAGRRDELWAGTRRRLGLPAAPPTAPPAAGAGSPT